MEGENHGRQRHDDVERQAEQAQHIVQIEPHALQILAEAQREQILHEARQEADQAGYDGDGITQGEERKSGLKGKRESVREALGGSSIITKKTQQNKIQ